jgi:hypothetical protein
MSVCQMPSILAAEKSSQASGLPEAQRAFRRVFFSPKNAWSLTPSALVMCQSVTTVGLRCPRESIPGARHLDKLVHSIL